MKSTVAPLVLSLALLSCATHQDVGNIEKRLSTLEKQGSQASADLLNTANEINKTQKRIEATLADIQKFEKSTHADTEKTQKRLDDNQTTILRNQAESRGDHDIISTNLNNAIGNLDEVIHRQKLADEKLKRVVETLEGAQGDTTEAFAESAQKLESLRKEINASFASVLAQMETLRKSGTKDSAKKGKGKKEKGKKKAEPEPEADSSDEDGPPAEKKTPFSDKAGGSADDLYNSAYDDYQKGNFSKSQAKFSDYVRQYPSTDLSYNAQYWLAESLANQGKMKEAAEAFKLTAGNYPKSAKASTALWRASEILEKTGSKEDVKGILRKIVDNYPASDEAVLAEDKLKTFGDKKMQE